MFFDRNGNPINQERWLEIFEPYYYLDGPIQGRRINRRNQGNAHVERRIQEILDRGLNIDDIPLVIAWKIGAINHRENNQNAIIYNQNWPNNYQFRNSWGRTINAQPIIRYIQQNFNDLQNLVNNPPVLLQRFLNIGRGNNFGIVYSLTLLYFFSRGNYPIYDRFAHISVNAIRNDICPGALCGYQQVNDWNDYQNNYVNGLQEIFGNANIERRIDRTLWAYGHFFTRE